MPTVSDLANLYGRRAVITGAAGALGRVMADTLAELGANLVLVDKPGTVFDELTGMLLERWPCKVEAIVCDLENTESRADLKRRLVADADGLNILINNAAFVGTSDLTGWAVPFAEQTIETWRRAIEVNLSAVFDLCQGLAPRMQESEGASIINIASTYGELGPDWRLYDGTTMANPAAYAASKGGVIQLTRWLATTLAPRIRVNSISPGGIFRNQPAEFVERYEARTPLRRMASENDFRGATAYLATDLSAYVTGQIIRVDGGWGAW